MKNIIVQILAAMLVVLILGIIFFTFFQVTIGLHDFFVGFLYNWLAWIVGFVLAFSITGLILQILASGAALIGISVVGIFSIFKR